MDSGRLFYECLNPGGSFNKICGLAWVDDRQGSELTTDRKEFNSERTPTAEQETITFYNSGEDFPEATAQSAGLTIEISLGLGIGECG